jgi:hypothetical protein
MDLPRIINYNTKTPILHGDTEKQIANFPLYIENLKILISFWSTILNENGNELDKSIKDTQFANWKSDNIIEELNRIKIYIDGLMNDSSKSLPEKYKDYEETLNSYTTDFTRFTQK